MRKKRHREVNPTNNYYDRFYVINYLELGKKWLEVLAEDFEDTMPTFLDSDEEEEEESWNEWREDAEAENEMTAVCLFCDDAFDKIAKLLDHMKEIHKYDLKKIFEDGRFGFYDRFKFINYTRKMSHEFTCFICGTNDLRSWPALRKHLESPEHLAIPIERQKWDKDEYLIPIYENDNLLCLLEDVLELNEDEDFTIRVGRSKSTNSSADDAAISDMPPLIPISEKEEEKGKVVQPQKLEEHQQKEEECKRKCSKIESPSGNGLVVIPEDFPEMEDSPLNDPELREQLQ